MDDNLKVEEFFSSDSDGGVTLSENGQQGVKILLDKYSGKQIKEICDVSRSALINYRMGANRISKRGQMAIKNLVARYNNELVVSENAVATPSSTDIRLFSDRELMDELKRRGYTLFMSV